jgi:hypothetical protein
MNSKTFSPNIKFAGAVLEVQLLVVFIDWRCDTLSFITDVSYDYLSTKTTHYCVILNMNNLIYNTTQPLRQHKILKEKVKKF